MGFNRHYQVRTTTRHKEDLGLVSFFLVFSYIARRIGYNLYRIKEHYLPNGETTMNLTTIQYDEMSAKMQETHNFHKVAAVLADHGFDCQRIFNDWNGADFVANHPDQPPISVQLKGRVVIASKYQGKDLYVTCAVNGVWYMYSHDALVDHIKANHPNVITSQSWVNTGTYTWGTPSKWMLEWLEQYIISNPGHTL